MASAPNPAPASSGGVSDHRPLTSEEMEAELDRIEAEEWATRRTEDGAAVAGPAGALAAPAAEGDTAPTDGAASDGAEDPFARQRAAQEKLERVMDLRMAGETTKARQLLYEVLVEGTEDQVFVARNILGQLDASG
jgi:hypothetical protein